MWGKYYTSEIRHEKGIVMSHDQVYRVKQAVLLAINGTEEDVYATLLEYCKNLEYNNSSSIIILKTTQKSNDEHHFKCLFIYLRAFAMGFVVCYQCSDLMKLTSKVNTKVHMTIDFVADLGILLSATAEDANGCLFPLAYAVVSAENDNNWFWFNQHLHTVIERHAPVFLVPRSLTFVSDRQKGLLESVERNFPTHLTDIAFVICTRTCTKTSIPSSKAFFGKPLELPQKRITMQQCLD